MYLKLIAKFFGNLTKANKILISVVLVVLTVNLFLMKQPILADLLSQNNPQLGGPVANADLTNILNQKITDGKEQAVSNTGLNGFNLAQSDEELAGFALVEDSAFLNSAGPLQNILTKRENLMIYKVQAGDTLSEIAKNFGISVDTIRWANQSLTTHSLKPGQEIILLPVSGVVHKVKEGETLESIANLYKIDIEKIKKYNELKGGLAVGMNLVIPDAKPLSKSTYDTSAYKGLPKISGYFALPTTGWNWGRLHSYNAVDIANSCGTPVYAAADGLVIKADDSGYNGGYGQFLKIEHPNGTATLYAHLSKIFVTEGQMVKQGELIGNIGNTGNTHGYTGCHLHFEVHGAQNPFAKY